MWVAIPPKFVLGGDGDEADALLGDGRCWLLVADVSEVAFSCFATH
jgi:hypothetical protein